MALGPAYAKNLARKAAPPSAMVALGGEDEESEPTAEPDEDADDAVAMSAYEDFARLAGFKPSPETFAAFAEAVRAVK